MQNIVVSITLFGFRSIVTMSWCGRLSPGCEKILTELFAWLDITIIKVAICSDHVHMYLSVPPKYSPSYMMKILKGKSAERLRDEFPELGK